MDGAGLALFTGGFGYGEVLIILLALLLIFGPRLPQVARALGKSFSSFKKGLRDVEDDIRTGLDEGPGEPKDNPYELEARQEPEEEGGEGGAAEEADEGSEDLAG